MYMMLEQFTSPAFAFYNKFDIIQPPITTSRVFTEKNIELDFGMDI